MIPQTALAADAKRAETVLIVDDVAENLSVLHELLSPEFKVQAAKSGERALRLVASSPLPDLILLDVMMPDLDGYQVFERLRGDPRTRDIPVIFLTAMDGVEAEMRGLELGAADYITKPIVLPVLLARVRTQLELKRTRDQLKSANTWLEAEVSRRMAENDLIQRVSIRALAYLAEARDSETGNHILRTQRYVESLARRLRTHPRFISTLNDHYIDLLVRSAPLHDIGKVGIPDAILLKPGRLDADEWAIMQSHARIGAEAIERAESEADAPVEFLRLAKEIANWHHEKWDGSGYPDRLSGDSIPVSARLMALADVFDALISERVYKPAMPYDAARDIIAEGRGNHFDPDVVDAFLSDFSEFCNIANCCCEPV
ncbi:MAG: response regulator [Gammaproteobacteria bacterium]|nr:response regulator [Gammaproteobacteria bacterium]MCB1818594.1 response regulator [Gammaproteobacteria bacterium]